MMRSCAAAALAQNCDMPEEMRQDCVDLVITAIEKFQGNYEVRARTHTRGRHRLSR